MVPDVATFAVDDGFAYAVPSDLHVELGSIVRVPLGGRRVRGWVVATGEADRPGLREVLAVSGDHPVLNRGLLDVVRWAAVHYVAPLAAVIAKTTPPNLPKGRPGALQALPGALPPPELESVADTAAAGRRTGAHAWVGGSGWADRIAGVSAPVLSAGRSILVVAASMIEAEALAADLTGRLGRRVHLSGPERSARQNTTAWVAMQQPGRLLVATREGAFWPIAGLAAAFVVEDGRRGLKDKATPTTHARDVLWRRSGVERFSLVLCGPVPTAEVVGRGATVVATGPRPWGLIEVVDRTGDPPGRGVIAERTRAALHAVVRAGGRAFVFTERRARAMRCVACRRLRVCGVCGARTDRDAVCQRCSTVLGECAGCGGARFEPLGAPVDRVVAEISRFLGPRAVGESGSGAAVVVGTERDLPGLGKVDLSVIVDADGLLRAPHFRAVEDGMRLMARVMAAAGPGRGRRGIVQTADPAHRAIAALRRGDPMPLVRAEIDSRASLGFPPHGELIVIEAQDPPADADGRIRSALGDRAAVLGPAERRDRLRWLIQGSDLRPARLALRPLVQDWRDAGARVRVDVDPIDL